MCVEGLELEPLPRAHLFRSSADPEVVQVPGIATHTQPHIHSQAYTAPHTQWSHCLDTCCQERLSGLGDFLLQAAELTHLHPQLRQFFDLDEATQMPYIHIHKTCT